MDLPMDVAENSEIRMATVTVTSRAVSLPIGTIIRITVDNGQAVLMQAMGDSLVVATFPRDDVNFEIEVDNSRSERGITFEITINGESNWYSVGAGVKGEPLQALTANGRKLHFKSQATDEGSLLVAAAAGKYGMRTEDAAVMCSRITFNVKIDKLPETILHTPIRPQSYTSPSAPHYFTSNSSRRTPPEMTCFRHHHCVEYTSYDINDEVDIRESVDSLPRGGPTRYGATPYAGMGERGVICYGEGSKQAFGVSQSQTKIDEMFVIKPFVIELRTAPRYGVI